jgi:hypothetical protein
LRNALSPKLTKLVSIFGSSNDVVDLFDIDGVVSSVIGLDTLTDLLTTASDKAESGLVWSFGVVGSDSISHWARVFG